MNDTISRIYDSTLKALRLDINKAEITGIDAEAISLASQLMEKGKALDIQRTQELVAGDFYGLVDRNFDSPPEYTSPGVLDQPWSDDHINPLEKKEQWNTGRRASNADIQYGVNEQGLPINPFFDFGVNGRGVIGRYGPNHAVDMGPIRIITNGQGKKSLSVLGIIREDNGLPALCGGFTNFEKDENGLYGYSKKTLIDSQANEFFEELVSGSVSLLPEYAIGLDDEISHALEKRARVQQKPLSDKQENVIRNQITTHRKLQQIEAEDPAFLANLREAFLSANECYAGPVLSSARNTNNAWMETKLSWFVLDEQKWDQIKGDDKFNYDFTAGDDAQDVLWHEINPELIDQAGNHSSLFCYVLSSYLVSDHQQSPEVFQEIKQQAKELLGHLPSPVVKPEILKL